MDAAVRSVGAGFFGGRVNRVNEPQHDSAHEQAHAHDIEALEMLADNFRKQECGDCGDDEGDDNEAEWMREDGAVAAFAARKCGEKFRDALAEIDRQAKDRAELDDDRVHLPVVVAEIDVKQEFGDAQMRGGADGYEFGKAFYDAEDEREKIVVQDAPDNFVAKKSGDGFDHRVGVAAARIIALPDAASTIAMLFPEGNCGVVFGCCFENHFAHAGFCEARFDGFKQARAYAVASVFFENVDRDNVAAIFSMRREAKTDQLAPDCGNQAIGAGEAKVGAKLGPRIGNVRRVAGLIDFVERFEIPGRVGAEHDSYSLTPCSLAGHAPDIRTRLCFVFPGRGSKCPVADHNDYV